MEKGKFYTYLNEIIEELRTSKDGRPVNLDAKLTNGSIVNIDSDIYEKAVRWIVDLGLIEERNANNNYLLESKGDKFLIDYESYTEYDDELDEIKSLGGRNYKLKVLSIIFAVLIPIVGFITGFIIDGLCNCPK